MKKLTDMVATMSKYYKEIEVQLDNFMSQLDNKDVDIFDLSVVVDSVWKYYAGFCRYKKFKALDQLHDCVWEVEKQIITRTHTPESMREKLLQAKLLYKPVAEFLEASGF
ncbi:MAG: hypothetical protein QW303_07205 [Nitrososphaerota archaeon]